MSFLDKVKATANKINDGTNVKPSLPGVKPNIPGKPPVGGPGKPPTAPGKPPVAPGTKPGVPGAKPPVKPANLGPTTPVKEAEIAPVEEPKSAAPLKSNNPFIKKPVTSSPKAEEKAPEVKEEIAPVEENPHALAQTAVNAAEAEAKEEAKVKEPKAAPKKTASRKKPAAKTAEATVVSDNDGVVLDNAIIIPKTEVSFDEAIEAIKSGFVDEAWETFRTENVERINNIVISNDMTTTAIKSTLSELSLLKDSVWLTYNDVKTMYESLTAKEPEGLIERVKKISSKGSNPEERKLNATLAVMNYKDENGRKLNLYELLDEMRERYNFAKSLMDGIAYKNSVLITMLGSLKLEK